MQIIAGGSSLLPGFTDHVRQYFGPYQPEFTRIGTDYAYSVAVGMGWCSRWRGSGECAAL